MNILHVMYIKQDGAWRVVIFWARFSREYYDCCTEYLTKTTAVKTYLVKWVSNGIVMHGVPRTDVVGEGRCNTTWCAGSTNVRWIYQANRVQLKTSVFSSHYQYIRLHLRYFLVQLPIGENVTIRLKMTARKDLSNVKALFCGCFWLKAAVKKILTPTFFFFLRRRWLSRTVME